MKRLLLLSTLVAMGLPCIQADILMDYNDLTPGGDHDAAVRDGDFENTPVGPGVNALFSNMPNWTNRLLTDTTASGDGGAASGVGGSRYAIILSTHQHAQSMGHTIASGDQFQASFMWLDDSRWDLTDHLKMVLFYTDDDTLTGSATDIITFDSGDVTDLDAWETETFAATGFSDPGAIGKTLMLRFESTGEYNEYAFFDNAYLEAIPEPAVITLVCLFSGSMLVLKRRFT